MMNYYNDFDVNNVAWLRELIAARHIPEGYVDGRSITDVSPADLTGYRQCHFFAGIAGWPLAFKLAGIPDDFPAWSGSAPCQPYSIANANAKGNADERNLAPAFKRLVAQCQPAIVFGEQVKKAIEWGWLDDLFVYLEGQGYACGAAVLPACSIGAFHQRDRILFGAVRLANPEGVRALWEICRVHAETAGETSRHWQDFYQPWRVSGTGRAVPDGTMADSDGAGWQGRLPGRAGEEGQMVNGCTGCDGTVSDALSPSAIWGNPDWLGCKDGKLRPVRSGSFPLADGVPEGMGRSSIQSLADQPQAGKGMRIRGYGNAIVPQLGAKFILTFLEAFYDVGKQY